MDQFFFIGGTPALDFVNTEVVLDGSPADLLEAPADLFRWLSSSGVLGDGEPAAIRRAAARRGEAWFREAKALRTSLRRLFLRLAEGESPRPADLTFLNDALSRMRGVLVLRSGKEQPTLDFLPSVAPTPATIIARSAASFLSTADLSRIRRCEGSGCILLFYDSTKSHTRRWCSMAACGNRMKAAAHYQRVKDARPRD